MTRDELLAAEFVIGTLDTEERAEVRTRIAVDIAFAARVRAWEKALAPLYELVTPVAPPPGLWHIISEDLDDTRGGVLAALRGRGRKSQETAAEAVPATTPASDEGRAKRRRGGKSGALQTPFRAVKGLVRGLRRQAPASEAPPAPPEPALPSEPQTPPVTRARPASSAARVRVPAPEVGPPVASTGQAAAAMAAPPVLVPAPVAATRPGVAVLPERVVAPVPEVAPAPGNSAGGEAPAMPASPLESRAPGAPTPETPPTDAAAGATPEAPSGPVHDDLPADAGSGVGELPLLLSLEEIIAPEPAAGLEVAEPPPHPDAGDDAPAGAPAVDAPLREVTAAPEPAADARESDDAQRLPAATEETPNASKGDGISGPATLADARGSDEVPATPLGAGLDGESQEDVGAPEASASADARGSDEVPATPLGAGLDGGSQEDVGAPEAPASADARGSDEAPATPLGARLDGGSQKDVGAPEASASADASGSDEAPAAPLGAGLDGGSQDDVGAPEAPASADASGSDEAPAVLLGAGLDGGLQEDVPAREGPASAAAGVCDEAPVSPLGAELGGQPLGPPADAEEGAPPPAVTAPELLSIVEAAAAAAPLSESAAPPAERAETRGDEAPKPAGPEAPAEPSRPDKGAAPNAEADTLPADGAAAAPAASADEVPEGAAEAAPLSEQPPEEPRWVPAWPLLSRGPVKQVIPAMVGPKGAARAQRVAIAPRAGEDAASEAAPAPERQSRDEPADPGIAVAEIPPMPSVRPVEREGVAAQEDDGPRPKGPVPAATPSVEAQDRPEEAGAPARPAADGGASDDNTLPLRRLEPEPSVSRYRRLLWGALALVAAIGIALGSDLFARWRGDGVPQPRTVTLAPVFVANPPPAVRLRFDPRTGRAEVRVDAPPAPPGRIYSLRLRTEKAGTHLLGTFASSFDAVADLGLLLGGNPPGSARLSVTLDSLDAPGVPGEEVYDSRIVE